MNDPELNIALEKDTLNRLEALRDIIPEEIATQLYAKLPSPGSGSPSGSPAPQSVPYSLLRAVSRWARTDAGRDALLAHQPPLDARDYDMIALLAGSTTSPEKHFPVPVGGWPQDERDRRREISDRKAVTNVVNALLSIGGCGVATWYAAGAAGWNNEWCVLSGLFASMLVAIAEAVLYIIWTTAPSSSSPQSRKRVKREPPVFRDLSLDSQVSSDKTASRRNAASENSDGLRHRVGSAIPAS